MTQQRHSGRVVRASRFELLDDDGRVRAVLGINPAPTIPNEELVSVGLEIYDAAGKARAWLLDLSEEGVQLALAVGGNQTVVIDTAEPGGEVVGGASITLCDLSGAAVLSWVVDARGVPSVNAVPLRVVPPPS